jgi:hypothetical protein
MVERGRISAVDGDPLNIGVRPPIGDGGADAGRAGEAEGAWAGGSSH